MGAVTSIFQGPPDPPAAPDLAGANREAILTDIETLPQRRLIEAQARAGVGQFAGLGDIDISTQEARQLLQLQQELGPGFVESARSQLEASDPEAFALRQETGRQLQEDLAAGGELSASERREIEQSVRGSQAARGNLFGVAPAVQEVLTTGSFARQRRQQAQAAAQEFAFGRPLTSQFGDLSQAQQQAAPSTRLQSSLNPNAGFQGQQGALGLFGQQSSNFQSQASNFTNPFLAATGLGLSAGGLFAGGGK